jgi:uncharacterized membrane protein
MYGNEKRIDMDNTNWDCFLLHSLCIHYMSQSLYIYMLGAYVVFPKVDFDLLLMCFFLLCLLFCVAFLVTTLYFESFRSNEDLLDGDIIILLLHF